MTKSGKDEAMGKLFIINSFLIFGVFCLMISCKNEGNQTETLKLDSNFVSYKFTIDGKIIHFSLPAWYTDKGMENKRKLPQYVNSDIITQGELVFFSKKSDNSFFSLYIRQDNIDSYWKNYKEYEILDSIAPYLVNNSNLTYPGTTFTEKKWDKNNQPYYLLMSSSRYYNHMHYSEPIDKLIQSDSIESYFTYLTYFEKKGYLFTFSSIESLKEFSYEEKRKVLESITIEEIR